MSLPYWRLSSFYFFYFLVVGANLPYWSLYLQSLGFTPQQIGLIVAAAFSTKLFSPNLWAALSDRFGQRLLFIRIGAIGGALAYAGIFFDQSFVAILLVVLGYSFFWNAILAQYESLTLVYLAGQSERYSHIRLWGSVSFIVAVVGLGIAFDYLPISYLPVMVFVFLVCIALSSFFIREQAYQRSSAIPHAFMAALKKPAVAAFFAACILLEVSLSTYYTFFSVYMEAHGYSHSFIGWAWALSVIAEIAVFVAVPQLLRGIGVYWLFIVSLAMTALRWLLLPWFIDKPFLLVGLQLLHAFSYGTAHAACVEWIRQRFSATQGHALAFYSATSYGLGAAIGAIVGGVLWDISSELAFNVSSAVGIAGVALALYWRKHSLTEKP